MIGLHVRNVFDAPRDQQTNKSVEGAVAQLNAEKEYGKEVADTLLRWRRASHWTNFVGPIHTMIKEQNATGRQLRFYLSADSNEAYVGLLNRFPGHILLTRRECHEKRCDFRDCRCAISYANFKPGFAFAWHTAPPDSNAVGYLCGVALQELDLFASGSD